LGKKRRDGKPEFKIGGKPYLTTGAVRQGGG